MTSLSCHRCYTRKVKCDRVSPICGGCARANVDCSPAVNTRTRPNLKKRYREAELHDARERELEQRIQQLEAYLESLGVHPGSLGSSEHVYRNDSESTFDASTSTTAASIENDPWLEVAATMSMVNGNYEDVYGESSSDKRQAVLSGVSAMLNHKYRSDGTEALFGTDVDPISHPEPHHIFHLWGIYRQNVQPLTQVVYEPVIDDILVRHGSGLHQSDPGAPSVQPREHAILFAIYYAALQTMNPDTVSRTLGRPFKDLSIAYRSGTRHWLNKSDFCRTTDVQTLQALVIYLVALEHIVDPRSMVLFIAMAKAVTFRIHATLAPPVPTDTPSLDIDLVRRAWWALAALQIRVEDRGGHCGRQAAGELERVPPLPEFVADSALGLHPASTLHLGDQLAAVGIRTSKRFVCARSEILDFTTNLHKDRSGQRVDEGRLQLDLGLINRFQARLRSRYLSGDDEDHTLRFARMWSSQSLEEMRLGVGLLQERLVSRDDERLRGCRTTNLDLCMSILARYVHMHRDAFFSSAGWHQQDTGWVTAILHLFRLCQLLVLTDGDTVQRAWTFIDAHYDSTLGGVALRNNPDKPGTLDKAMLSAWDGAMDAAATLAGWKTPMCVLNARIRTERASGREQHGPDSGLPNSLTSTLPLQSNQSLAPTFNGVNDNSHQGVETPMDLFPDLAWSQSSLPQDWYFWQDAL